MMIALVLMAWLGCAAISYGFLVAVYQGHFPELAEEDRVKDRIVSGMISILGGPPGLIAVVIFSYAVTGFKYGWRM